MTDTTQESFQDYAIIRECTDAEETSSWAKSFVGIDPATGKRVFITHLDKDKLIKHYSYMPNPEKLTEKELEKELAAIQEKALAKYKAEEEKFIAVNKKVLGLSHPSIIKVIGIGRNKETGEAIVVREFSHGTNVYEATKGLIAETMVPIFLGIIQALKFIHNNKLLHLNLKPRRIRVFEEETGYTVKITDFGYAVDFDSTDENIHTTPAFCAPEALLKQKVSEKADLYSVGVIMYYCLARALPFPSRERARDLNELIEIVNDEREPMKPSEANPMILDMPHVGGLKYKKEPEKVKQLEEIIMGLIKKDADERPFNTSHKLYDRIVAIFPEAESGKTISSAVITTGG